MSYLSVMSISQSNFIWCTLSAHRPAWLCLSEYPVFKQLSAKSGGFDYKVFLLGFPDECRSTAVIVFCCLRQTVLTWQIRKPRWLNVLRTALCMKMVKVQMGWPLTEPYLSPLRCFVDLQWETLWGVIQKVWRFTWKGVMSQCMI